MEMENSDDYFQIPAAFQNWSRQPEGDRRQDPVRGANPQLPLLNLSTVRARMVTLQRFLSASVNSNIVIGKDQMEMVSTEITTAIHQIIVNGAALLACSQQPPPNPLPQPQPQPQPLPLPLPLPTSSDPKFLKNSGGGAEFQGNAVRDLPKGKEIVSLKEEDEDMKDEILGDDLEIIEVDAVELLAEHIHFCEICGKGFKRDANLRMHMRAHGNQFKTPEALAKPEKCPPPADSAGGRRRTRFSCPYVGCNRNKQHKKFRPLKSAICVKNHFKRCHCPKMYSCNRCNKKSFSVVGDLKSHLKHCGESRWRCSCGTTFSRKDKLFGHMALFEGHMPAVMEEYEKTRVPSAAETAEMMEEEEEEDRISIGEEAMDYGFFEGLLDGFGSIEGYCLQDVLDNSDNGGFGSAMNDFFSF